MPLQPPVPGFNAAQEFQISGIPWVTSSIVSGVQHFSYGYVTRAVTVRNVSGASSIRVAFTENGLSNHYFQLASGEGLSEELRSTDLWVSGSGNTVSVIAGLTLIPSHGIGFRITGSQGDIFTGVG